MELLFQQNLVERKKQKQKGTLYAITESGRRVLKYFRRLVTVMRMGMHNSFNLKFKLIEHSKVNMKKSAGPAIVILAGLPDTKLKNFERAIRKPINIVGHLF